MEMCSYNLASMQCLEIARSYWASRIKIFEVRAILELHFTFIEQFIENYFMELGMEM